MKFGKEYFEYCIKENNFDMNGCGGWHDMYFKFLKNVFPEHMNEKTISLDVGCATGSYLELFRKNEMIMYGCDVSAWYITACKFPLIVDRLKVIENNKIPFEDEMFDFIHCSQVVEHIPEKFIHEEVSEVFRTLKQGGIFYVSTVGEGPEVPGKDQDPTHISCFSREKWLKIFEECGFLDITERYADRFKNDKFASIYDWVNFVLTK